MSANVGVRWGPRTPHIFPPFILGIAFSVSHTTDDLIFEWDPQMPLDVDSGIELPQLELTHNYTGDCTTAYSTGIDTVGADNYTDPLNTGSPPQLAQNTSTVSSI